MSTSHKLTRLTILAAMLALFGVAFVVGNTAQARTDTPSGTIPPVPPTLTNPDMECDVGYYEVDGPDHKPNRIPNGWQQVLSLGHPRMNSARIQFGKSCDAENVHIERMDGRDSFTVLAWDLETPPDPGKPFDVTIYQQTPAVVGGDYSVSGWFLTLCGGSNHAPPDNPNDCPDDVYMAKMLGLDPTGGVDPDADTVIWVENRDNFVDGDGDFVGWSNLYTAATATTEELTVFARINSPFQWHGNHGFIDAIRLIRSPFAEFVDLPAEVSGDSLDLTWDGKQSPDVETIAGGNYDLLFDIDFRNQDEETWQTLVQGTDSPGCVVFQADEVDSSVDFRIRSRAEQPEDEDGVWPNQRYPGPWSDPQTVFFRSHSLQPPAELGDHSLFLPQIVTAPGC